MEIRTEVRATLHLALPIAFAQVALMAMGLVDAAMVGRVSAADLSAVSLGNSLAFAMLCPAMGVTMAVEPLASQAIGAGDERRAWLSFRAGLIATLALAVPTMIIAAASTLVLEPIGVDPTVIPAAKDYVLARLPGMPCWLIFMAAKAYLEAKGRTRPLLIAAWVANVVNFVVCALLVFGDRALERVGLPGMGLPQLGSLGAGIATTFSNILLAIVAMFAAWEIRPRAARLMGPPKNASTDEAAADRDDLKVATRKLTKVGVPIGFQVLTEAGVFSLVSLLVGRLGAVTSAAHQIALGLASFTFMGVLGMSGATAVRVGRAIGAREALGPRRAGLVGMGLGASYMTLSAVVFLLFPRQLAGIFTEDPAVLDTATTLVRVAAAFQIADGIQGVAGGALRGAADTRFASWANVACHWGIGLPSALLLAFGLGYGALGLWWGLSLGLVVVSVVLTRRFLRISSRAIAAV